MYPGRQVSSGRPVGGEESYHKKTAGYAQDRKAPQDKNRPGLQRSIQESPGKTATKCLHLTGTGNSIGERLANYTVRPYKAVTLQCGRPNDGSIALMGERLANYQVRPHKDVTLQCGRPKNGSIALSAQVANDSYVERTALQQIEAKILQIVSHGPQPSLCVGIKSLTKNYLERHWFFHVIRLTSDVENWKLLMAKIDALYRLYDSHNILETEMLSELHLTRLETAWGMSLTLKFCFQLVNSWPGKNLTDALLAAKYAFRLSGITFTHIRVCPSIDDKLVLQLQVKSANGREKKLNIPLLEYPEDRESKSFLREFCILLGAEFMVDYWREEGAAYDFSPVIDKTVDDEAAFTGIKLSFQVSPAVEGGRTFFMKIRNPEALYCLDAELPDVRAENWLKCLDQLYDDILMLPLMMARAEDDNCSYKFSDSSAERISRDVPVQTFLDRFTAALSAKKFPAPLVSTV